ncbi:hypothetical protein BC835DRAFT_1412956 [Cytidiella melzeri]|nr:hypothetical protein BC835DRAFT_1412956 [Cytidiella melzeri]
MSFSNHHVHGITSIALLILPRLLRISLAARWDQVNVERSVQTTSSADWPVFPQEILDHIDGFVDHLKSLLACCLSSRALLYASTRRTWQGLAVKKDTYDDILRALANSPLKAPAVQFIRFWPAKGDPRCGATTVDVNQQAAMLGHLKKLRREVVFSTTIN